MIKKLLLTVVLLLFATTAFGANQFIINNPITSHDTMFVPVYLETDNDSLMAFEFVCKYPEELSLEAINWDGSIVSNWPLKLLGTHPAFADNYTAVVYALWANGSSAYAYVDTSGHAFTLIFKIHSPIVSPVFEYTFIECPPRVDHIPAFVYQGPFHNFRIEHVNVIMDAPTDVDDPEVILPVKYNLYSNYPNPFNPATVIKFDLPTRTYVDLQIINILGQTVETLCSGEYNAGTYTAVWNASNYSSGVYFYRLVTDNYSATRKMLLVK